MSGVVAMLLVKYVTDPTPENFMLSQSYINPAPFQIFAKQTNSLQVCFYSPMCI